MNFYCPNCKAYYTQPDDQIPPTGLTVRCLDCGTLISLAPPAARPTASPPPSRRPVLAAGVLDGEPGEDDTETVTAGPQLDGLSKDGLAEGQSPGTALRTQKQAAVLPAVVDAGHGNGGPAAYEMEHDLTVPVVGPASVAAPLLLPGQPRGPARAPAAATSDAGLGPQAGVAAGAPAGAGARARLLAADASADRRCWRWSDLWLALRGACQPRRTLETTVGLFASFCLITFIGWLGAQSASPALRAFTTVLSLLLAWIALSLTNASLTSSLHQELTSGRRSGMGEGLRWALGHLGSVMLTPLAAVGTGLTLLLLVGLLHLPGWLPWGGKLLYGLGFGISLLLCFGTVLLLLLDLPLLFYYLPLLQDEDRGPGATVRTLGALFAEQGGRAAGLLLLSTAIGALLLLLLGTAAACALGITTAMGLGLLGSTFPELVAGFPAPLLAVMLPLFRLLHVEPAAVAAPVASSFAAGPLLTGLGVMSLAMLLLAVVLAYFCGAGLISYYALTGRVRGGHR
ncbi:MAG: hypothetical protein FJ125_08965 [Deltaproteobacteria bacterium]|nr:hypothetical protein [Deltaproteobacteria bacterium]